MSDLDDFIKDLAERQTDPVAETRQLARELALGVHKGFWSRRLSASEFWLVEFLERRWGGRMESDQYIERLIGHGFVVKSDTGVGLARFRATTLTTEAFGLLAEAPPFNVFISYKRSESSAFALLVSHKLHERGLVPFVDMAIKVGEKWHGELHQRIKDCDYFIVLLGRNTLKSEMTIKEIKWAIQHKEQSENEGDEKKIIPIWHRGFNVSHKKWACVDEAVKDEIKETNAIRVKDESASGYNTAIVELLNRFGITP